MIIYLSLRKYKSLYLLKQTPYNIEGVRLSPDIDTDLKLALSKVHADKIFFLFDENTFKYCKPLIGIPEINKSNCLIISSGEENKNLDQVRLVWDFFEEKGAGRNSVLVNVGGGMLTDLGGFAACTFKRGMSFINIPTTLLAMVDASVGGKTGINYNGLKNEIGIIKQPNEVLIHAPFLKSLDQENFISGFAEMLKAGLIKDVILWNKLVDYNLNERSLDKLVPLIWKSVLIKKDIVDIDPEEKLDRRALNFGHTFAHAFESLSLSRKDHLHHGYAVAYGMIFESLISQQVLNLKVEETRRIDQVLREIYGSIPFTVNDINQLTTFMKSDKKNDNSSINITMLETIGKYRVNNYVDEELIVDILKNVLA